MRRLVFALAITIVHVPGGCTAAHPAIGRHAFHQVGGIRDGGCDGRNEGIVGGHGLLRKEVDAALVGHVIALLQLGLHVWVGLAAAHERHGCKGALKQADAATGTRQRAAADEQLGIGVNVAPSGADLVPAREIDVGLAGGELDGTLHGAVVRKKVLQHVVGRFHILDAALS